MWTKSAFFFSFSSEERWEAHMPLLMFTSRICTSISTHPKLSNHCSEFLSLINLCSLINIKLYKRRR